MGRPPEIKVERFSAKRETKIIFKNVLTKGMRKTSLSLNLRPSVVPNQRETKNTAMAINVNKIQPLCLKKLDRAMTILVATGSSWPVSVKTFARLGITKNIIIKRTPTDTTRIRAG